MLFLLYAMLWVDRTSIIRRSALVEYTCSVENSILDIQEEEVNSLLFMI